MRQCARRPGSVDIAQDIAAALVSWRVRTCRARWSRPAVTSPAWTTCEAPRSCTAPSYSNPAGHARILGW